MKRESFIFYKSFYDSIKELDLEDQVQIYNAIFNYEFENNEIELKGVCKSIFTLIIPQLEANNKRYENGCKGGRPKTKTKPKNNQNETETKPNVNDNVNDNDNVNVIYIVDYLNEKAHKNFKHTQNNLNKIKTRLKEGFTLEDFKQVIDKKCSEWLNDPKMNTYLRPETLFGSKFESYLQQESKTTTPNWVGKTYEQDIATKEEQQEMNNLLSEFRGE